MRLADRTDEFVAPPSSEVGAGDERVIAVIGEALVDLMPHGAANVLLVVPGGSPANVAVGLARLAVPVRFIARTGSDSLGEQIRRHLVANRVDLSYAVTAPERSSVAIVELDAAGNAHYDFRIDGTADWRWQDHELLTVLDGDVVALHAGSLATTVEPGREAIFRLLERAHSDATISYDPNCRPGLMRSPDEVRDQIRVVHPIIDVLRASADDIAWLYPGRPPLDVAKEWLNAGPALVVVTLGMHGAFALGSAAGHVERPGRLVDVVDTVGAGDSFTSALLAALYRRSLLGTPFRPQLRELDAATLGAILDEAVLASSITCTRKGAQPPELDELAAYR